MGRAITLVYKHGIGAAGVKRIVDERFAAVKRDYIDLVGTASMTWIGDTAEIEGNALGQQGSARVAVTEHDVTIQVDLPWLLSGFADQIEGVLRAMVEEIGARLRPSSARELSQTQPS